MNVRGASPLAPASFPEGGLTLHEALNRVATAEEVEEVGALRVALRNVRPPRDEPWMKIWPESDDARYQHECLELQDRINRISRVIEARLRRMLSAGDLVAEGIPLNGEKALIDKDLWSALPRLDFRASSAFHPKTGRRFDGIRIVSGQPDRLAAEFLAKAEKLPPKMHAAVRCIVKIWGPGGIPAGVTAKEWLPRIQQKAAELQCASPQDRTVRKAREWMKQSAPKAT